MFQSTFVLLFFPSLIFFLTPNNQIQPLSVIPGIFLVLLYPKKINRVSLNTVHFCILIIIYIFVSLFFFDNTFNIILNGLSYLAPLICFLAIHNRLHLINPKIFSIIFYLWLIVGCIQYFDFFSSIRPILQIIGEIMIADRFSAARVVDGEGGRGVSFLMPEPSGSAIIILVFLQLTMFLYENKQIGSTKYYIMLAMNSLMFVMNSSGTCFLLYTIFLIGLIFKYRINFLKILQTSFLFLGLMYIYFLYFFDETYQVSRMFEVISYVFKYISGNFDTNDFFIFTIMVGGFRTFSLLISYGSIIENYMMGHGVASWNFTSVTDSVQKSLGVNQFDYANFSNEFLITEQIKPWSYASIICFDIGILGLVFLFILIYRIFLDSKTNLRSKLIYFLPATFIVLFMPPISLVAVWLMFAMSLNKNNNS